MVLSWKEGNKEKRMKSVLSLRVHVLFKQEWVGDMINIHTHAHNILAYSQDLAAFAMLRPPPPCSS